LRPTTKAKGKNSAAGFSRTRITGSPLAYNPWLRTVVHPPDPSLPRLKIL
jgi:hypothetical protein